jgi:hypothetical protein
MSDDYIAGLIDGEGYIGLWKRGGISPGYCTGIKVAMVNSDHVLLELKGRFGGYIEYRHSKQPNHRPSTGWSLRNSTQVEPFLRRIAPRLHIKQREAELLLEFCSLRPLHPLYAPKEKFERAAEIHAEIQAIRWKSPATTE